MNLDAKIESILCYTGETMTIPEIAKILKVENNEIVEALKILEENLSGRGVELMQIGEKITLATNKDASEIIDNMRREELNKELSKASLETLSVVLYKGGCSRSEIDYIRGVNSAFILRNLQLRGLIEKKIDSKDARRYVYEPTMDLLGFLGVRKIEDLPDFELVNTRLTNSVVESSEI